MTQKLTILMLLFLVPLLVFGQTGKIKGKITEMGTDEPLIGANESLIADPTQRELMFDMENLRASLRKQLDHQSPELLTLDKSMANLMRMWSQT